MSIKEKLNKLNGSKRHIGTWVAIVISLVGGGIGYGKLQNAVANNKDTIGKIEPKANKVAVVEVKIQNIEYNIDHIQREQTIISRDIKDILKAVGGPHE